MIPRLKACLKFKDLLAILPKKNKFEEIRKYEIAFAELAVQSQAIFFPYGRTAQLAILNTLGLKKSGKTEVILPSYNCVVVAHAIKLAGLTPVFVDIGDDYNMRLDLLSQATNEKTGAVIATSLFGHPVNLETLDVYRQAYPDIPILQDCAHSFFAQHSDGRYVHKNGLCAFYGLNISKIITSIFGGMVTTDDEEFARQLRAERQRILKPTGFILSVRRSVYLAAVLFAFHPMIYGIVNRLERTGLLNRFTKYYDETQIDWPNDGFDWPSSVQARIGILQCIRYHNIVEHRRKIAAIYNREFQDITKLTLPLQSPGATFSHYVVQTDQAEKIENELLAKGYQLGRLIDYEVPDMPVYQYASYYGDRLSRTLPGRVINLPVHWSVTTKKALALAEQIKLCVNECEK